MRLLFAIKRLEDMAGGAERVILQVVEGLHQTYAHEITLVTFDAPGAQSFYPVPEGIRVIQLGIGDSSKRAGIVETLKRMMALRRVIRESGADIFVPFQHSMFVPFVLAKLGLGGPVIASEHIVPDHYKSRKLEYILLILTGLLCERITVLSEAIVRMYPRVLRSRMVAMPNPVATSSDPADVVGGEKKTLISVGRLDPQKDQKTLIEAFSLIADRFPDWTLRIMGEGRLRSDLEKQVEGLGLVGRVQLPGLSKDIMAEYQSAQAFVLASLYEAFGLATAEAMSAGLPVVGFADCAGTNELILDGKNGLLVRVARDGDRAESLAEVLSLVMRDGDLRARLGRQGRLDMAALSVQNVVDKWQKLLLSVA